MLSLYRACAWLHDLQYCFQLVAKQSVRKGRGASKLPHSPHDWQCSDRAMIADGHTCQESPWHA